MKNSQRFPQDIFPIILQKFYHFVSILNHYLKYYFLEIEQYKILTKSQTFKNPTSVRSANFDTISQSAATGHCRLIHFYFREAPRSPKKRFFYITQLI